MSENRCQEIENRRQKPKTMVFCRLLSVVCFLLINFSCTSQSTDSVCFDKTCFEIEIASTPEELQRGLQLREHLDENRGMLFIFSDHGIHRFWMKNTLIPLDMIWMDASRRIVHMERNVPPCKMDPCAVYDPKTKALYVLEINSGLIEEAMLKKGDMAKFNIKELDERSF